MWTSDMVQATRGSSAKIWITMSCQSGCYAKVPWKSSSDARWKNKGFAQISINGLLNNCRITCKSETPRMMMPSLQQMNLYIQLWLRRMLPQHLVFSLIMRYVRKGGYYQILQDAWKQLASTYEPLPSKIYHRLRQTPPTVPPSTSLTLSRILQTHTEDPRTVCQTMHLPIR